VKTEPEYDASRNAPDQELCRPVIGKVRRVSRISVGAAIIPSEQRSHDENRHDYDHHDGYGVEQDLPLGKCNRTFGIENRVRERTAAA